MADTHSLADLLELTCERHEPRHALGRKVGSGFEWTTYGELRRDVAQARQLLKKLGVGPQDRVAIIADNCVEWVKLCYATAGCRAVFVPMYTAQSLAEWMYILNDSGAKLCFCGTPSIYRQISSQRHELGALEHLLCLQEGTGDCSALALRLADCTATPTPPELPGGKETAAIIYTSGTTGLAKGVMLSHENITSNAIAGSSLFPIGPEDRSLSLLPWAHAFGQTVDLHLLLRLGVAVAINDDVTNLLSNLVLCRPTILVAVPRVFHRIHDNVRKQMRRRNKPIRVLFDGGIQAAARRTRGESLSLADKALLGLAERLLFARIRARFGGCLRFAICGSAALGREVAEFINALGIELYEGYGLTEASPVVSVNTPSLRRFGTVGPPLPGVTVTIDRAVTRDPKQGEILVSGPNVMQGYYLRPNETTEVLTPEGALRTGDMGYLDDAGYLVISGRIKEQYKLENGKYVVPAPIEARLRSSPLIAHCVVYGADKPYNVVLVVPNRDGLAQRLEAEGGTDTWGAESPRRWHDPRIPQWILQEVRALGREFRGFERPKRVAICEHDFTVENGLLTPSLKPKRNEIIRRYQSELDALYRNGGPDVD
jgi:long-chain acyl-CoA synthetase